MLECWILADESIRNVDEKCFARVFIFPEIYVGQCANTYFSN